MTLMFHPLRSLKAAVFQIGSAVSASEVYSNEVRGTANRAARGDNALIRQIPL
ncbi:hypothetical protein NBH19_04125 [Rhizobium sp. S95]|uniref:Uncharacterized protein n=1 Tax=Ciceribacter sichuanensis TaxID=2949647 RepID=A0AAJ1BT17_9HYPH|nr:MULTISPECIES: hypothetical protein [unclassified Ciceribacter]MCM2395272.1 hypothetical protein [Ciceribacter sp. S95]MCM2400366.1 hypothetical protein [Ciceribacter sp. S153]MCO5955694.1 hypothetical protein [Ciceribacter sp. S101]